MFTTLEGDWDDCMAVVKRACEVVGRYGSRVSLVLKADIRPGHTGELTGKVARVEAALTGGPARDRQRRRVTARIRIGVSGWTYPHWRSVFYPRGLAQRRELEFASRAFDALEINGSFYSLQRPSSYRRWRDATPDDFVFAVKGSRFITHIKKLGGIERRDGQLPGVGTARARAQARSDSVATAADAAVPPGPDGRRSLPDSRPPRARPPRSPPAVTTASRSAVQGGPGHRCRRPPTRRCGTRSRFATTPSPPASSPRLCRNTGWRWWWPTPPVGSPGSTRSPRTWSTSACTATRSCTSAATPTRASTGGPAGCRAGLRTDGVREVQVYFDNDGQAHAPYDARRLAEQLGVAVPLDATAAVLIGCRCHWPMTQP